MQQLLFTLALLFTGTLLGQTTKDTIAMTEKSFSVTITVVNASSDTGQIRYALYDRENFMVEPIFAKSGEISEGRSTVIVTDLPAGIYAVLCFHDANENGRMDFDLGGMPAEDYGSSNNVMNYGPPNFEDAKFELSDSDLSLEIKF